MAQGQIIIRRRKPSETRIQNSIIWDDTVSNMARFSLIAMLSMRAGWDYSVRGMAVMLGISKDTMSKYIRELERAGYIKREQANGENGKFEKSKYILTDTPFDFGLEIDAEMPCPKNYDTGAPCPNLSAPEKPAPEKSPQQICGSKEQKREEVTPPISPEGDKPARKRKRSNGPKAAPDWMPDRFEGFWSAYPCGKSKQAAIKAWDNLRPDERLLVAMAKGLQRALASEDWKRGIGIPYAATWLNNRRWEDEDKQRPVGRPKAPKPPKARKCHVEMIDGEEVVVYDD